MKIKKLKKIIMALALLLVPVLLTGCGGNSAEQAANKVAKNQQEAANGQNKSANVISLYQGTPHLVGHYITVPIIIQNLTKSPIQFDSSQVSLQVKYSTQKSVKKLFTTKKVISTKEKSLNTFSPDEAPSNFELQMGPNDQLQTFFTFKITEQQYEQFTKKQFESAKLVYKTPDGKVVKANMIPQSSTKNNIQTQLSEEQPQMFNEYYKQLNDTVQDYKDNIKDQEAQLKDQVKQDQGQKDKQDEINKDTQQINSYDAELADLSMSKGLKKQFKDSFNDPSYGDLTFTICREDSSDILFEIYNPTQINMEMSLNNFRLEASNLSDIQINPRFNNYSLFIPAQKTTYAVFPTSSTISKNSVFKPQIKINGGSGSSGSGSSYISTNEMPNPIKYERSDDE